ncbi:hypothetical protein EBS02_02955 [bacterium]|nr:hypothetical protein [bacterium]
MTTIQQEKIKNRINSIESILNTNKVDLRQMSALFEERNELEFKLNKVNILFTLKGKNKYYYATHCKKFTDNLLKYGYGRKTPEQIKETGITFNNNSINFGYGSYTEDLKRFESKSDLLHFIVGYNAAVSNLKDKTYSM